MVTFLSKEKIQFTYVMFLLFILLADTFIYLTFS